MKNIKTNEDRYKVENEIIRELIESYTDIDSAGNMDDIIYHCPILAQDIGPYKKGKILRSICVYSSLGEIVLFDGEECEEVFRAKVAIKLI